MRSNIRGWVWIALAFLLAGPVAAEKRYGPGVTDTEIKLGQTMPYSGPNSAYATVGRIEAAYYRMVNDRGGVNGRSVRMISLDDAFNPAKTVEQTRKLVEQENVLAIVGSLGTAPNSAVHRYLNAKKVPHIFLSTGASKWGDPQNFPWTMGWQATYLAEGRVYGRYLRAQHPAARIAVLYLNDDLGRDYLRGLEEGLGDKARQMIVAQQSFEIGDPTVDSQIITLHASGADVLIDIATPKAAVQAIRKVAQVGWKPMHFIATVSTSIENVIKPAGADNATGLLSVSFAKDVGDPATSAEAGVREYFEFVKKYYPEGNPYDLLNVLTYSRAQTIVHVLAKCSDDLTRENLMRQAASIDNLRLPLLQDGVRVQTNAKDFYPIEEFRMIRFDGTRWVPVGEILSGH